MVIGFRPLGRELNILNFLGGRLEKNKGYSRLLHNKKINLLIITSATFFTILMNL